MDDAHHLTTNLLRPSFLSRRRDTEKVRLRAAGIVSVSRKILLTTSSSHPRRVERSKIVFAVCTRREHPPSSYTPAYVPWRVLTTAQPFGIGLKTHKLTAKHFVCMYVARAEEAASLHARLSVCLCLSVCLEKVLPCDRSSRERSSTSAAVLLLCLVVFISVRWYTHTLVLVYGALHIPEEY